MTSNQYYQYIERLAAAHRMVAHTDAENHYFRGELEEFYTDLRNRVHFPAVVAESFEITFPEGNKDRETSIIIAVRYKESRNWPQIYAALDLCELIGDEFLRRMATDMEDGTMCGDVEFLAAVPMVNEQHLYAGIRYTIRLTCPFSIDPDEDEWTDL